MKTLVASALSSESSWLRLPAAAEIPMQYMMKGMSSGFGWGWKPQPLARKPNRSQTSRSIVATSSKHLNRKSVPGADRLLCSRRMKANDRRRPTTNRRTRDWCPSPENRPLARLGSWELMPDRMSRLGASGRFVANQPRFGGAQRSTANAPRLWMLVIRKQPRRVLDSETFNSR
jgi:hypothetical protein